MYFFCKYLRIMYSNFKFSNPLQPLTSSPQLPRGSHFPFSICVLATMQTAPLRCQIYLDSIFNFFPFYFYTTRLILFDGFAWFYDISITWNWFVGVSRSKICFAIFFSLSLCGGLIPPWIWFECSFVPCNQVRLCRCNFFFHVGMFGKIRIDETIEVYRLSLKHWRRTRPTYIFLRLFLTIREAEWIKFFLVGFRNTFLTVCVCYGWSEIYW